METARPTTNESGNLRYSADIDLQNLKTQEVCNKPDIWSIDIKQHKKATISALIDGLENPKTKNAPFNFLASHISHQEKNFSELVRYEKNGSVKEIITAKAKYRARGYHVYTKRKNQRG